MNAHIRVRIDSLDTALGKTVRLVVESQGEPRKKLIAIEVNRDQLIQATTNHGNYLSAHNQCTTIDGVLVQD